jgi:hypothetical protein
MEKISSDKEAKENAGKSFAIQLANDLEINEQEGLLAFRLFWPCKECILAYLFSILGIDLQRDFFSNNI